MGFNLYVKTIERVEDVLETAASFAAHLIAFALARSASCVDCKSLDDCSSRRPPKIIGIRILLPIAGSSCVTNLSNPIAGFIGRFRFM